MIKVSEAVSTTKAALSRGRFLCKLFALWGGMVWLSVLILVQLSGCGGGGRAQYFVSGKVMDALSGNPIAGATVKIYQASKGRVTAGALLLGEGKTESDGSYKIPISVSGVLWLILSVEPPSQDYTRLEMEMNLDVMQKISLDAYLIKKDDLGRISRIEIKPPLAEGESYIAGQSYTFGYTAFDQNNKPMKLAGVNWYAKGDIATIDSKGNFVARHPDPNIIIGIILGNKTWEMKISVIAPPPAILCAKNARANEIKGILSSEGFNVQVSQSVPTDIGQAKVLVIDESATLSTADANKVENILKRGGNVVLIGDAPAILATGKPLPPNNPEHQNWTPTDVSSISSWFFGVKRMMHVYDFNIHALTNGLVPLPAGLTTDYILECEESACALTPFNAYFDVQVIATSEIYTDSASFPNTEVGDGGYKAFAIAQRGLDDTYRLYWQWNYKASQGWEQTQPGSSAKVKALFINGVKWVARLLGPQPQ
jgi:hypothetical protein